MRSDTLADGSDAASHPPWHGCCTWFPVLCAGWRFQGAGGGAAGSMLNVWA